MRLLEVDEAANHILELVDPDANIIWGSAFNPDLDGKIRVSVVATGIDADAAVHPPAEDSARVFSFSPPKNAVRIRSASSKQRVDQTGQISVAAGPLKKQRHQTSHNIHVSQMSAYSYIQLRLS